MKLIGVELNKEQIEEMGIDLIIQCIKFNVIEEELTKTLQLNILGVIYSASVPTHECSDPQNIRDCWQQLIQSFGVCHMLGQKGNIQHGSRKLSDEEIAIIEASPSNKKGKN